MTQTSVLIVDDDPSIRKLLRRWLDQWGYAAREAGDATEALAMMLASPAHIVICDIRMPSHDGLWLIDRVHTKWPRTVTIVASCVDDFQTIGRARKEGVVDYLSKPFGRELLRQALNRAHAALNVRDSDVA